MLSSISSKQNLETEHTINTELLFLSPKDERNLINKNNKIH